MKQAVTPSLLPVTRPRPAIPRPALRASVAPKPVLVTPPDPEPTPRAREPFDSSVRFVDKNAAGAGSSVLDALHEKQMNFTMDLVCLEAATADVASDRAEARWLDRRGVALSLMRDSLHEMLGAADEAAVAALVVADSPLTAYLHGLYLYCDAVTRALARFAARLHAGDADWAPVRERVAQATHWYFDGLPREVRSDALCAGVSPDALDKLDDVFFSACFLAEGLEEK